MNYGLILKNISNHIQLDEKEIEFFVSLLKQKRLKKKECLLSQGDISYFETFVVEGCLRSYYTDSDGIEHIVMFAPEDWWINDLYSFLTQKPADYSIDALEETEILQIEKSDLELLYQKIPKFERFFRIKFQNAFVAHQRRITESLTNAAETRYQDFIRKYPQLEQRIPQKQIASFLGITPEFLSMIRKKMASR